MAEGAFLDFLHEGVLFVDQGFLGGRDHQHRQLQGHPLGVFFDAGQDGGVGRDGAVGNGLGREQQRIFLLESGDQSPLVDFRNGVLFDGC